MSIKEDAHAIIDQLNDDANWNDLVKALYLNKKITLGMTDLEVVQDTLSESDVNGIIGRLQSASTQPDDMRNTRTYKPGDAATLGMVAGVVAILFSFVFPPIAWVAAPIAIVAGAIGLKNKEDKAWVPILLALISIVPMISILADHVGLS
ncbi:hypothetical protein THMIRHAM_11560 [Thiomicrorhabdus immobilis]|uniref:DUF1700 domain-containing protein n=1 Tax=Thiomicrorhabdus immobilis TaxID=2791037 RepID=A0ABN6CWD0_9GAMM|nr:hypothetical protein [Thiomicrorhabdus immobilis]BCN93371.1 hypothetical protein THMIRHAM_11560 [Thiomicrorhabdus immobilis]